MQTVPALLFVVGFSLASLLAFIVLSDASLFWLIVCYFAVVVFGFYLNYDLRKNVRYARVNQRRHLRQLQGRRLQWRRTRMG